MQKEVVEMTAEQKAKYDAFLQQEKQNEEKARVESERTEYKKLMNQTVESFFPKIEALSKQLSEAKTEIYESFQAAMELKESAFGLNEGQQSHSFINEAKTMRIMLGYHTTDGYDDTVSAGIGKVHEYIESLAKDAETRVLVKAILKLLQADGKTGQLKASKVMQLRSMANESGNAEFIDGVSIIEKAYSPTRSKQYVRAERKNDKNEWINIPLGMTEA